MLIAPCLEFLAPWVRRRYDVVEAMGYLPIGAYRLSQSTLRVHDSYESPLTASHSRLCRAFVNSDKHTKCVQGLVSQGIHLRRHSPHVSVLIYRSNAG